MLLKYEVRTACQPLEVQPQAIRFHFGPQIIAAPLYRRLRIRRLVVFTRGCTARVCDKQDCWCRHARPLISIRCRRTMSKRQIFMAC